MTALGGSGTLHRVYPIIYDSKAPGVTGRLQRADSGFADEWFILGELLQPTMICIDTNLMSCTLEILTPFFKGHGNCKQFLVGYLIINLMLIYLPRMKSDRVQKAFELL